MSQVGGSTPKEDVLGCVAAQELRGALIAFHLRCIGDPLLFCIKELQPL